MSGSIPSIDSHKMFGGYQNRYQHHSAVLQCDMHFSVYLPPKSQQEKVPVLYWLSGLTCTDENFVTKAGAQRIASELGIAIVTPDTSPRGEGVPDDSDGHWDFGLGAGFYINATQAPWTKNYRMYDYIVKELPDLIEKNFPVIAEKKSICGHSMGGHGAIMIAVKNPGVYKSVSAFSPIVAPTQCPWGEKAFSNYLGDDRQAWLSYDSCELIKTAEEKLPLLVDQGTADNFLREQLKPELLEKACREADYPLQLRLQDGYDHSYFFIATFIEDHIRFHFKALA